MPDLAAIDSRIASLRQQRGAIALDGGDHAEIDAELMQALAEREAREDASTEATRRQRQAAAAEWEAARQKNEAERAAKRTERIAAVAALETATRAQLDALNAALLAAQGEAAANMRMGGKVPVGLSGSEIEIRLSRHIAGVWAGIKGHPRKYGHLTWFHTGGVSPRDWAEIEAGIADYSKNGDV